MATTSEAAIFGRLIKVDQGDLTPDLARYLLSLEFRPEDKARMHDLAVRNQDGRLSAAERDELDNFVNVGHLLAVLQSKARKSLRRPATPR
ncbi:MAG TPA: hypothetical protein VGF55_25055 [Gemmataceae bacterium]